MTYINTVNQTPLNRRASIKAGVLGALGLSMSELQQLQASQPLTKGNPPAKAQNVIQLHLKGGFQQQESFDPKPESPLDYRGHFGVTKTNTGDILSDNFKMTAKVADKINIIRSVVGKIPDHAQATYHLFTGYTPTAVIDYPQMGAVISHKLSSNGMPPFIGIPNMPGFSGGTGFLSSTHGAFELNSDPGKKGYKVKDLSIPSHISMERFKRRQKARNIIEQRMRDMNSDPNIMRTMDDFYQQAYGLLTSEKYQSAFSLAEESQDTLDLYGSHAIGLKGPDNRYHPKGLAERLIVARRLVQSGVRFVTVEYGAFDCHTDVKKNSLDHMPALDHGIAGLVTDLDRRGMLDSTIFWVTSEFGRTPKINKDGGRDHWARCYSMLIAGGGFTRGQFYGASDATGAEPDRDAVPLEDLLFTIYHQLGIDASSELMAFGTRPIEIIKNGQLLKRLINA